MPTLKDIVDQYHQSQPHPRAPDLTVGEYPVAAKLATLLKFGTGHAEPQEVSGFWKGFQQMNATLQSQKKLPIQPEEFSQLVQQMAQVSYAYHGRPPSMTEITKLRDAHPKDVHDYFAALPDQHYPHVSAGHMVKSLESAKPWAHMNLGRQPNKQEASYLHHSGHSPQDYYRQMAADSRKSGQGQE
jgi:hypothetical protein